MGRLLGRLDHAKLCRVDICHAQARKKIEIRGALNHNLLDAGVVEIFEVGLIVPADILGLLGVRRLVSIGEHHDNRLATRLFANGVERHRRRGTVLALGRHRNQALATNRLLRIAQRRHVDAALKRRRDGLGRKAELTRNNNRREEVVQVRDRIVAKVVCMSRLPLMATFAHGKRMRIAVERHQLVIGLGVGKTAALTMRVTKMAQMAVVVLKLAATLRTSGKIAHDALRIRRVVLKPRDGVVNTIRILRRQTAADHIVCIQDKLGCRRDVLAHYREDEIGVGVAREGIAVEVRNKDDLGNQIGQHGAERKLVELHYRYVELLSTREGGVLDKCALNAVANVAARTVIDHLDTVIAQQVAQQVIRGCLAVRSGDENNARRLVDIGEKRGIDLFGDNTRHLSGITARKLERRSRGPRYGHGEMETRSLGTLSGIAHSGFSFHAKFSITRPL